MTFTAAWAPRSSTFGPRHASGIPTSEEIVGESSVYAVVCPVAGAAVMV